MVAILLSLLFAQADSKPDAPAAAPSVETTPENLNRHLYPSDTTLVALFDLDGLRATGLFDQEFKEGFDAIVASNESAAKLGKILSFDPTKDIKLFTVCAGRQQGPDASGLMIVNADFPYDKMVAELAKMADSGELTQLSINDLPVYFNHRSREALYFAVVDPTTVIASSSKRMLEDSIQGLTELREPKEDIAEQMAWGDEERQKAPLIRLTGVFPEEFRGAMGQFPPLKPIAERMVGYNLTVHMEDQAIFQARLTLEDASTAQNSVRVFRAMLEMGKAALTNADRRPDIVEMLEGVNLAAKGNDLFFKVNMTPAMLQKFLAGNRADRAEFVARRREQEEKGEAKAATAAEPATKAAEP